MLSRKQLWRKQKKTIQRSEHDILYFQGRDSLVPNRSSSEPTNISLLGISNLGRLWSTTTDLELHKSHKKKVKFGNSINLILIPTRDEYQSAGLASSMWWETEDYDTFKQSAVSEIKTLMLLDSSIDIKTAQVILYQPNKSISQKLKSSLKPNKEPDDTIAAIGEYKSKAKDEPVNKSDVVSNSCNSVEMAEPKPINLVRIHSQADISNFHLNGSTKKHNENHQKDHDNHSHSVEHKASSIILSSKGKVLRDPITKDSKKDSFRTNVIHPLAYLC